MKQTLKTIVKRFGRRGKSALKKGSAVILAGMMLLAACLPVFADSTGRVIALGADLNADEKAAVLAGLGLTDADLSKETVITVTNAEEHEYLDSYLPKEVIGTRALSSCVVESAAEGSGIKVTTHNINYCTTEMYQNALATAGVKDANVTVAGPFGLSGTAALVGAIKAYAKQEGILIKPENIDVSTNEIVTTSQLGETIGDAKKAAQLIAAVKELVAAQNLTSDEEIGKAIDEIAIKLEISLSEEDRQMIIDLMKKIGKLDLDIESLTKQAGDIYEELKTQGIDLSQYGITESDVNGFVAFFVRIWEAILRFFGK